MRSDCLRLVNSAVKSICDKRWFAVFSFPAFAARLAVGLKATKSSKEYMRLCGRAIRTVVIFSVIPSAAFLAAERLCAEYFANIARILDTVGMVYVYIAGILCAECIK